MSATPPKPSKGPISLAGLQDDVNALRDQITRQTEIFAEEFFRLRNDAEKLRQPSNLAGVQRLTDVARLADMSDELEAQDQPDASVIPGFASRLKSVEPELSNLLSRADVLLEELAPIWDRIEGAQDRKNLVSDTTANMRK